MCLVEVEKMPKLQTACTLVATDGMVVKTDTEQVHKARKDMIEFLLSNHPLDCPVCDKGGECELQDMTFRYGLDKTRFVEEKLHYARGKMVAAGLLRRAALHSLLPLRARLRRRHGRESSRRRLARRAVRDPAQQARRTRLRRVRHVHRYLPGRRAHQRHLSLSNAPVGNDLRRQPLRALLERLQDHAQRAQQRNPARQQSRPFRHQRRISLRQGPLRLRFHDRMPSASASRWFAATASSNPPAGKTRSRKSRAG